MDNLIGYPLIEALKKIEEKEDKIISIKKIYGTNKNFGGLERPYVVRSRAGELYITLFVTYY
jgi:hypothetical protein